MIYLSPRRVTLGTTELTHVSRVTIDRTADLLAVEHSDLGPHVEFVDVPEQRITVRIVRTIVADEAGSIRPGQQHALTLHSAASSAAPEAREVTGVVVVTGVEHDYTLKHGLQQTITAIALAGAGGSDPITEAVVAGGG
jgi:hypothetical protein